MNSYLTSFFGLLPRFEVLLTMQPLHESCGKKALEIRCFLLAVLP